MRRSILPFLAGAALLASAGSAEAQTIGFKLGASLSNFAVNEDIDYERKTGFVGGGFARFGMGRFGIQPEILSVSKGAEAPEGAGDGQISLEYIEIPVLLHIPFSMGGFAPYVVAGPAVAFEIGCTISDGDEDIDCEEEEDGDDEREKTDFGITAGAGLSFPMGPGAIIVEGRYTWGMTNLNSSTDPFEIKNRAAYITAGFEVPLGRRY